MEKEGRIRKKRIVHYKAYPLLCTSVRMQFDLPSLFDFQER